MEQVYGLLVRMSLDVGGLSGTAAGALRIFSQMEKQALAASGAVDAVGNSLKLLAGGAALTGAGLAGIGVMKGWVSAAQQVQDALANVSLATHKTQAELRKMGLPAEAYQVASVTRFSAPDVLRMAALAATGGINNPQVLMGMLPTLARVAEITKAAHGTGIDETVPALVSILHQFQAYGAQPGMTASAGAAANAQLQALAGRVAQAQTVSSLTPAELQKSLAYLTQAHAGLSLSAEQAVEFTAFSSNVGLTGGQGGGGRLRAFFQRMAGGSGSAASVQNRDLAELEKLGHGSFFDAKGTFEGVSNAFAIIQKASEAFGANQAARLRVMTGAFGATGAMIATVGATPEAAKRQQQLAQIFGEDPVAFVLRAQQTLNSTMSGQVATLQSNMSSIAAILGTDLLPPLIAVTHALVGFTGGIMNLLTAQPILGQAIVAVTAIGTAAALVVGPILLLRGALGLLALTSKATAAAEALQAVAGGAAPVAGVLGSEAAAATVPTWVALLAGGAAPRVRVAASVARSAAPAAGVAAVEAAGGAGLLGTLGALAGVLLPVTAAAAGVYLILTRWKGAMDAAHTAWLGLGDAFGGLLVVAQSFGDVFSGIGIQLGQAADYLSRTGLFQHLGDAAHGAALGIGAVIAALQKMSPHPATHAAATGPAATLDPNATLRQAPALIRPGADRRIPGSIVTALPQSPAVIANTPIFGGTVGLQSPMLPLPHPAQVGLPHMGPVAVRHHFVGVPTAQGMWNPRGIPARPATAAHATTAQIPITIIIQAAPGIDHHRLAAAVGPIVHEHVQKALAEHDNAQADIFGGYLTAGSGVPQGLSVSLGAP